MDSLKLNKKKSIIFLLIFFCNFSYESNINNPEVIITSPNPIYPIIIHSNDEIKIYTSGRKYTKQISSSTISDQEAFCEYSSPYTLISSNNELYIYWTNSNYLISLTNSQCHSKDLGSLDLATNTKFVHYIEESKFEPLEKYTIGEKEEMTGLRCRVLENEIILYGKIENKDNIVFYFIEKNFTEITSISCGGVENYMSCKKIENSLYICAFSCDNRIKIYVYAFKTKIHNFFDDCEFKSIVNDDISIMKSHTEVRMFNTSDEGIEFLCAKNINNKKIECIKIKFEYNEYEEIIEEPVETDGSGVTIKTNNYNFTLNYENEISFTFPLTDSNNEHCIFKKSIENEYLFCCGGNNIISCARIDNNLNYINSFNLNIPGENTYLDFIASSTFIILFYNNYNENILEYNKNKLSQYSIYFPICVEKSYIITSFHSFIEEINNLFTKEIDSEYYIEFITIPSDYGNLTIDNELIDLNYTTKFLIKDSNILNFTSTTDKTIEDFKIIFKISMKETFSVECSIKLSIIPCYESCNSCTKSASQSNSENHNCYPNSCKEDYYVDPEKNTNCWRPYEAKNNWYFDYEENKFKFCDSSCESCNGPQNTNCLSCKPNSDLKYLLNNKCYLKCPDGFYPIVNAGKNKCDSCFETCAKCSEKGDVYSMKCESCKENSIIFRDNCFKEYNEIEKSFYIPGSNEISSCFENYNYYIKENTYECISSVPSEGYYISNSKTGVFSPCHEDCKTCYGKYTEISANCKLCKNETLNFFQRNCIENCPEGYYSKEKTETEQKQCVSCYPKCQSCEKGQEYDNSLKLIKMNCLKCKKEKDPNNANILLDKYIFIDDNCFPFETYTEEKIIFNIADITMNSNLNEKLKTCLDYNLSIFYEEYKCIEKPENTYYVLNNEENTGVIKYCNEACSTCNGEASQENTNCIICKEGYFKTEDSQTNCILESLIPENYYKNNDNNIYYKCYPNCLKCKRSLDFEADINNMGCEICIDNYYLVDKTNNCYNISFLDNNIDYYLNENKFYKCYKNCKKCSVGGIETNQNCEECLDDYYYAENTNNCYDFSIIEKGYYFDNFTINLENEIPKFKKCFDNCKSCSNHGTEENMNCILCKDGYYKIINTNNCINDITNKGYYLKDNTAIPCSGNCLTCSDGEVDIAENNLDNNGNIITNSTYNCLSCDETKHLFLVENLNNCESLDFKNKGYYLKENQFGIKLFHKCYKSCSLCDKDKEIDSINNKDIHNCKECAANYYKLLNDNYENNCYGNEMLGQGYRLARNFWQNCHENCGLCFGKPVYDETNTYIINQNCETCYEGFYFIHGTKDCADETYLEKGYYFDDSTHEYYECDITCISCQKYSTASEPKCIKCNNEKGYFSAENKPADICYSRNNIEPIYILSTRYDENGNIYKKWALCYHTCFHCSFYGNEEEHGCTSCISKHYLIYNTSNCVMDNYALNNGYYFNNTYSQYVKCDDSCVNCFGGPINENTNCKKCNNEKEYYSIEGKSSMYCYNSETIGEGYYLNKQKEPYVWSNCYENCATCEFKGTENKMNCFSCRTNLKNKNNKIIYFIFINGNCIESCPDNLFLTKDGDCVSECPEGTHKFQLNYNYSCVEFCPNDYLVSSDGKNCELPEFQKYVSISDFKSIISDDINSHVNSSRVINLDNLKAQIMYSKDLNPISQINNKISTINNIENIIQKLKTKNSIDINEDLIVVLIESKENKIENESLNKDKDIINLGKGIDLIIYDKSGNKLDISSLKNEKITIMKYIEDIPYIDLNEAKELYDKGIDVFKESESFFNDICYPYKSNSSSDIILADRRTDLFQNITFCDEGCIDNGIDYKLMIVNCICDIDYISNENNINKDKKGIILNNNKNEFSKKLYKSNIVLAKCSNLVFDIEILKNNAGFYIMTSLFTFEIIFIGIFFKNGLKPIKNFMLIFEPLSGVVNPPKLKKLMTLASKNSKNNKDDEIKKTILINHLLNKNKKKIKKQKDEAIKGNNALFVDYMQNSNSEDFESNKNSINNNTKSFNEDKSSEKDEKDKSLSEKDSDSEKEKRTRITKKVDLRGRRKSTKNNFIYPNHELYKEKKEYIKEKEIHPIDTIDFENMSINKNYGKKMHSTTHIRKYMPKAETEKNELESQESDEIRDIYNYNKNKEANKEEKEKTNKNKKSKKKSEKEIDKKYNKINEKKNIKQRIKNKNYKYTTEELSIMSYEEAIKNDKRAWFAIYLGYLIEKNFYLNTFISDSFIDLKTIKINLLFFRLEIIFVLNALFYTDSYISEAYHNNGNLNFGFSLPKAIYSILVSIIVTIFLKMLTTSKKEIYKKIKENDDKLEYSMAINDVLNNLKIKLIAFFICQFIFSFIFLYYVSAFCAVYQNSKLYWFYGCLESIAIDFLIAFIYCIFITTFRYFGLKNPTKCLFEFSNILNILL